MKKVFLCVMSCIFILCFSGILGYAVSTEKRPGVFEYASRKWADIRDTYLLHDTQKRFEYTAEEIETVLSRTASLLQDPFFAGEGWLQLLKEDGIIDAAYIRTNGSVRMVGSIKASSGLTGSGYLVDERGKLRFVYIGEAHVMEVILNERYIKNLLASDTGHFFLYDTSSGGIFTITENGGEAITGIDVSAYLGRSPVFLKINQILITRLLRSASRDVYIVSVGPFVTGYVFFYSAALIVLLISAILLFVRAVLYSVKLKAQKDEGAHTMDKKPDVIHEIDIEISDIIEEETPGKPKEKSETQLKKESTTDTKNRLESEGIIIKK